MKKIIIIASLSAIIAIIASYSFLNSIKEKNKPEEIARESVIVAAVDISKNSYITEEMVKKVQLPSEAILPNTCKDANEIIGKIADAKILVGEQILMPKVYESGEIGKGLAYAVHEGMRAYTVAVDAISGLAGMLEPGNHVDIYGLLTIEERDSQQNKVQVPYSFLLLQNINVLAIEDTMVIIDEIVEPVAYESVTLEMLPEQIDELNLVANTGRIQLALRSPIDEAVIKADVITPKDLMNQVR